MRVQGRFACANMRASSVLEVDKGGLGGCQPDGCEAAEVRAQALGVAACGSWGTGRGRRGTGPGLQRGKGERGGEGRRGGG